MNKDQRTKSKEQKPDYVLQKLRSDFCHSRVGRNDKISFRNFVKNITVVEQNEIKIAPLARFLFPWRDDY
jgi:hypothetical protein